MYSIIIENAKELLEKINTKKITITRPKLSDKIDIRVIQAFNDSILETQVNGEETLYFSGKIIGEELIRNYEKEFVNLNKVLIFIKGLLKKLMLGIVKDIEKKEKIIIQVDECAFCKRGEGLTEKKNKCHFLTGFISGIITGALNKQCAGKEIYCRYNGDPFCVFEITFSEEKELVPAHLFDGKYPLPTSKIIRK